jgi:hypothetical protein
LIGGDIVKVFNYKCPKDNMEFISLEEGVVCEECGTACEVISEGDTEMMDSGIVSILEEEGTVKTVRYRDGKKVIVMRKKKKHPATPAQKQAAANARKYAHTSQADKKRKKSLVARKDAGLIGEGVKGMEISEARIIEAVKKAVREVLEGMDISEGKKVKVVRDGEVVTKVIKTRKVRLSSKQKAALKKAQAKSHTGAAKTKRAKSMKKRDTKGLKDLKEAYGEGEEIYLVIGDFTLETMDGDVSLSEGYSITVSGDSTATDDNCYLIDISDDNDEIVAEEVEVDIDIFMEAFQAGYIATLEDIDGDCAE